MIILAKVKALFVHASEFFFDIDISNYTESQSHNLKYYYYCLERTHMHEDVVELLLVV